MSGNFLDEQGRVWEFPHYNERNCIHCGKRFIIQADDMTEFSCGRQDAQHPVFVYSPSAYRIDGPEAA